MDVSVMQAETITSTGSQAATTGHQRYLTSFFGRESEIAEIRERLESGQRLVTIVGPGGVGKTRLASVTAESITGSRRFPDGYAFVALASVASESLVTPTIAQALGIVAGDQSLDIARLAVALQGRRMLLVVDNLEHLIGAGVEFCMLLSACPELSILVTSRRPLRVSGEQEFVLSPLAVPEMEPVPSVEALRDTAAIALFIDRAASARPGFVLDAENAASVIDVCARLDGLPLAIELAAARSRMLSPQALAMRLSDRLHLLTAGRRDAPLRQQTLRETIAWSYSLLSPEEQQLFQRMAVFAGGGTLEAIAAVADPGNMDRTHDTFELVASLVEHSLLVSDADPADEPRFRMLETIREFALNALQSSGDEAGTRDSHAAYFTHLAGAALDWEFGSRELEQVRQLEPEVDNIRGALSWLTSDQEFDSARAHMGLRLARSMSRPWDLRGRLPEHVEWLTLALRNVSDNSTADRGAALMFLGHAAWAGGQFDEAVGLHHEALAVWQALGDATQIAEVHWMLGLVAISRQDMAEITYRTSAIEQLIPDIGTALWVATAPVLRGYSACFDEDWELAMRHLAEALTFVDQHGYLWPRGWVLGVMARIAMLSGDFALSLDYYQQSLAQLADLDDVYGMLTGITAIATLTSAWGNPELGATLLGLVRRMRLTVGNRRTWSEVRYEEAAATIRAVLGDDAFEQAEQHGTSMQLAQAARLAMDYRPGPAPGGTAPAEEPYGLTSREQEILRLLSRGLSNQDIGERLFISHRTAATHIHNIYTKLGVHSRAAAVALALNEGLV